MAEWDVILGITSICLSLVCIGYFIHTVWWIKKQDMNAAEDYQKVDMKDEISCEDLLEFINQYERYCEEFPDAVETFKLIKRKLTGLLRESPLEFRKALLGRAKNDCVSGKGG